MNPAHSSPAEPSTCGPPSAPLCGGWLCRFGFRFVALYLIIFTAEFVLNRAPGLSWASDLFERAWQRFTPWFGRTLLGLPGPMTSTNTGSGDTLFNWVQVAAMLSLALLGALVWVWFDRARRADRWVDDLMRIAVRYSLAASMLNYGMAKILYQQMSAPSLYRLLQPYGESSPMGLLWTFMGQSWAYSAFAGGLEFVGGLLLFFRRTTALGALLLVPVLANVFLMNLCFDVPVKLYTAHYLAMALMLAAPAARRLLDVLVWHRATAAAPRNEMTRPWPPGDRARRLMMVVKVLIVGQIIWSMAGQRAWTRLQTPLPEKSELYGLYEVAGFTRNGEALPAAPAAGAGRAPLPALDTVAWKRVGIEKRTFVSVLTVDDRRRRYRVKIDAKTSSLVLEPVGEAGTPGDRLRYSRPTPDQLILEGPLAGAQVTITLRRADEDKTRLINRGFRWISETPFSR